MIINNIIDKYKNSENILKIMLKYMDRILFQILSEF